MAFGLTSAGYTAPRTADFLDIIRDEFSTRMDALGFTIDYERDVVLSELIAILASELGTLGEISQALYDAFDVNNATGLQLSNLGLIVGVSRLPATNSTVGLTLSGTAGTVITAGSVAVGGTVTTTRWIIDDDVTIGGGGTVAATATAEDKGELSALAGTVTQIATPISGWTGVTNAADAVVGTDLETDAEFRVRRQNSLQIAGGGSNNAIRAAVEAVDGVTAAVVIDNPDNVATVVEGVLLEPNSVLVIVFPSTISATEQQNVALAIYERLCTGIETNGTDVMTTVTGLDGFAKAINFDFATSVTVSVDIDVTLGAGFTLVDVDQAVQDAITDVFETLQVGETVTLLSIICAAATVEGVVGVGTVLLDGVATDYDPDIDQLPVVGTITVT